MQYKRFMKYLSVSFSRNNKYLLSLTFQHQNLLSHQVIRIECPTEHRSFYTDESCISILRLRVRDFPQVRSEQFSALNVIVNIQFLVLRMRSVVASSDRQKQHVLSRDFLEC